MDKPTRIVAQVYGYAVCLVAVITFLIATTSIISSLSDLGDPLHAGYNFQNSPSLASFQNYKMDLLRSGQQDAGASSRASYVPDDATLQAMYEAAKKEKIDKVNHDSNKSIKTSAIMVLLSLILFITHWRWMQKKTRQAS
jgi:hypothetical protein